MTDYLYLDIETVGAADPAMIAQSITPPSNYKKPETIAEWEATTKQDLIKDAISKAGLRGETGRVVCVGWAWNNEPPSVACLGDEAESIFLLFATSKIELGRPAGSYRPIIVGHNVASFDLRFLWQRAFVLGVKLPAWFPRNPKPWDQHVHDTMNMWDQKNFVGLDAICRAMGIEGKGDVTGADVQGMWERGEYEAIAQYCEGDVSRVREVHRKMLVAYGEKAA